ncbi:MAG: hypothetical protein NT159_21025 [Proteobacteria bacterium]|nr:hypothetical protein [Pseudomonadota bacterium]
MKIFLAFSFRDEDKLLASQVERLLASQFVQLQTGEQLGGALLTDAVKKRIEDSDALIALLTRREQLAAGGWTTHPWVQDELTCARTKGKLAIALVEEGVDAAGMFAPHEHIPLSRTNPVEALLRLAETVAEWNGDRGRMIKVRLTPEDIAEKLGQDSVPCRHRFVKQGKPTSWREAMPFTEPGGTFVWVDGIQDEHLIQVKADQSGQTWQSFVTPQWVQVQLKKTGGIVP